MSEESGGQLPHLGNALIADTKISGYLLAETHPRGRNKAAFFKRFGFDAATLREALLEHAAMHEVAKQVESTRGTRYVIDGALTAPDGRQPHVRTVWFLETGAESPHLVTAYPLRGKDDE